MPVALHGVTRVASAKAYLPSLGVFQAQDQVQQGGLALAAGAQDRHALARFHPQIDTIQHRRASARRPGGIAKADAVQFQRAPHRQA
ncbi:hypothetical protein D3C72_1394280 [compost metagenome]